MKFQKKTQIAGEKNTGVFQKLREGLVSGIFLGFQDFVKKATLSFFGAVSLVALTFSITHFDALKANLFAALSLTAELDINELITANPPGETLFLPSGEYTIAPITLSGNIHLVGEGEVILESKEGGPIFQATSGSQIIIENITFTGATRAAIFVGENVHIAIRNSIFEKNTIGLEAENAADVIVENSFFTGADEAGISLKGVPLGSIRNTTFALNRTGIMLTNSEVNVWFNYFRESTENALYLFSDASTFRHNIIENVPYGVGVNFRRGVQKSVFSDNYFSNMPIGMYATSSADTSAVKIDLNIFVGITENIFVLPTTPSENFTRNLYDDSEDHRSDFLEQVGCVLEKCFE